MEQKDVVRTAETQLMSASQHAHRRTRQRLPCAQQGIIARARYQSTYARLATIVLSAVVWQQIVLRGTLAQLPPPYTRATKPTLSSTFRAQTERTIRTRGRSRRCTAPRGAVLTFSTTTRGTRTGAAGAISARIPRRRSCVEGDTSVQKVFGTPLYAQRDPYAPTVNPS